MRNVIDVPYLDQSVRYPTGCESVSAVMLLRYLGYEMSVDEFIEQYLDRQEFEFREGELYGPDPTKYFCGSPYDEESFGCYAPVITQALKKAIGEMYEVLDLTGTEIKTLQTEYIDKGMPVILWAQEEQRCTRTVTCSRAISPTKPAGFPEAETACTDRCSTRCGTSEGWVSARRRA